MKLEDEIRQKSFYNEHQKLLINILFTHSWLEEKLKTFFNEFDITPQQYNIMRILRGQSGKGIGINVIRERMIDKMSDASRIVERLRKKGLVERKRSDKDGRAVEVFITEKGKNILAEIDKEADFFTTVFNHLNNGEARTVNDLLDKARG